MKSFKDIGIKAITGLLVIIMFFELVLGSNDFLNGLTVIQGAPADSSNVLVNDQYGTVTSSEYYTLTEHGGSNRLLVEVYVDGELMQTLPENDYYKYTGRYTGQITVTPTNSYCYVSGEYKSANKNAVWTPITEDGVDFSNNNDNTSGSCGSGDNDKNVTTLRLNFVSKPSLTKTASKSNLGERFYDINLSASINPSVISKNADVVLVLDASGSMPWLIENPTTTVALNSLDSSKTDSSEKGWDYTYYIYSIISGLTYHEYIPIAYIDSNTVSYYSNKPVFNSGGTGWYRVEADGAGKKGLISKVTTETIFTREYQENGLTKKMPTKLDKLVTEVSNFIQNVKTYSPNSKIGITYFNDNCGGTVMVDGVSMVDSTSFDKLYKAFVGQYAIAGGTYGYKGLDLATKLLDAIPTSTNRQKYVVYFTDGNDFDSNAAKSKGVTLKNKKVKIYCVGLYGGSVNQADAITFLKELASDPDDQYYKQFTSTQELDFSFIYKKIIGSSITGEVRDYIDFRFLLVDGNGNAVANGASVYGGTYIEDATGRYVKWTLESQLNWQQKITVKAKEDFLGGNAVPTNTTLSGITLGSNGNNFVAFPMPTVNVPVSTKNYSVSENIFDGLTFTNSDITTKLFAVINDTRLTASANPLSSTTSTVSYRYAGTLDVLGTLSLKQTKMGDTSYRLEVVYTPLTKAERQAVNSTYIAPANAMNEVAASTIDTVDYTYSIVKGDLIITKKIDAQYTSNENPDSNQSFVFKIERYADANASNLLETFYEVISFSANEGVMQKQAMIKDLKYGYYKVTEETKWSWKYNSSSTSLFDWASQQYITSNAIVPIGSLNSTAKNENVANGVTVINVTNTYFGQQGLEAMKADLQFDCTKKYTSWIGGDVASLLTNYK